MFCSSIPSYLFPFLSSSSSSCHQLTESVTLSSGTVLTLESCWRVKMTGRKTDRESQSTSGLDKPDLSAKDDWFSIFSLSSSSLYNFHLCCYPSPSLYNFYLCCYALFATLKLVLYAFLWIYIPINLTFIFISLPPPPPSLSPGVIC